MAGDGIYFELEYVAERAGLFKMEGIDVEIVQVSSGSKQAAAVMGGSALATPVGIEQGVQSAQQGSSLVAIGSLYNIFPHAVVLSSVAMQKHGITDAMPLDEKIKRMKGMKIAISSPGSGTDSLLRAVLTARGVDPDKDISLQSLGTGASQFAAFEHGIVDGFVWSSPQPELVEKKGEGKAVVDPFSGAAPEYDVEPYITLTTSRESLADKKPELTQLLRAYAQAINFIRTNPAEARRLVRQSFKDADEDVFNAAFDKYLEGVPTTLTITHQQFDNTIAAMNARRPDKLTVKFDDVIDNSLADAVSKEILKP
jgi:NitT/TauT family transport system substrate-binding protein